MHQKLWTTAALLLVSGLLISACAAPVAAPAAQPEAGATEQTAADAPAEGEQAASAMRHQGSCYLAAQVGGAGAVCRLLRRAG